MIWGGQYRTLARWIQGLEDAAHNRSSESAFDGVIGRSWPNYAPTNSDTNAPAVHLHTLEHSHSPYSLCTEAEPAIRLWANLTDNACSEIIVYRKKYSRWSFYSKVHSKVHRHKLTLNSKVFSRLTFDSKVYSRLILYSKTIGRLLFYDRVQG